jgi:hypothetical protein
MKPTTNLAPLLERFFTQRLMMERRVSPHTSDLTVTPFDCSSSSPSSGYARSLAD